ncbi:MAG: hypothetical protein DMF12_05175 [Verrucomicrobia bacterium]|nr:MAG: hypothetical protein DMF12_05175 [Verrucomicrobiota bacterium]
MNVPKSFTSCPSEPSNSFTLLVFTSSGFVASAAAINRLTFILAPVALFVIFFYSLTKRFTSATHFFLGLALAIAPLGAWIAQTTAAHPECLAEFSGGHCLPEWARPVHCPTLRATARFSPRELNRFLRL